MPSDSMVIQGHEDRIQRLEDTIMSSSKVLAEHGVTLEAIKESLDGNSHSIERKIDEGFSAVRRELIATNETVATLTKGVASNTARLDDKDKTEKELAEQASRRREAAYRVIAFIGAGVGAIVLKYVTELAIAWFQK